MKAKSSNEIFVDETLTRLDSVKFCGSRYKPLKHSECTKKISEFIQINSKHGFDLSKIKYPAKTDCFYSQLQIFILKLRAFNAITEKYRVPVEFNVGNILLRCLREGFPFNEEYKKICDLKTRDFICGDTDYVYTEYPASHLLPWLDETPIQDMYVFREPIPVVPKRLQMVEEYMKSKIIDKAYVRDIDLIDAIYLLNNKKTAHMDKRGKTRTSYEARGNEFDISFSEGRLDYLFKKVTTDPATSRVAGLSTVKTRNLVYAAHSNLDLVTIKSNDLYKTGVDQSEWKNRLSKSEGRQFIMLDFKKSGLTTNREVIKSVYRAALSKYPGFRPWVFYLNALDQIYVNGHESLRGTSLGMDDNAISFFVSCAYDVFIQKYNISDTYGYFKGDDQVIIVENNADAKKILRQWVKFLAKLGFLVNTKKTYIGLRGQFCEIVGNGPYIDTKIISESLCCFDALGAYNCVDYKIYMRALKKVYDTRLYSGIWSYCAIQSILCAPKEFAKEDIETPFEAGGYFSNYERGLNTFIVDVIDEKIKIPQQHINIIGIKYPEMFEFEHRSEIFDKREDMNEILSKLIRRNPLPMSKRWKKKWTNVWPYANRCTEEVPNF